MGGGVSGRGCGAPSTAPPTSSTSPIQPLSRTARTNTMRSLNIERSISRTGRCVDELSRSWGVGVSGGGGSSTVELWREVRPHAVVNAAADERSLCNMLYVCTRLLSPVISGAGQRAPASCA